MRIRGSRASLAGFTLIEAMAAVSLMAAIILAMSSVAGQWLPNWRRGFVNLQRADLLGLGLERIAADVSAAEYVKPYTSAPAPLFEGGASSVTFVRSAVGPDSYPQLEVVRLAETRDERGFALVRTRAPFAMTQTAAAPTYAFGDAVVLVRAPLRISFTYAGPDRAWTEIWRDRERLPDAVRIKVRDTTVNRELAASTAVRLKVTAQGVPKPEGQASAASASPAMAATQAAPSPSR